MAKIALIHHSGVIGGAGVSLINTIKALSSQHEITVFVSDSPDDILKTLKKCQDELGIKVESYGHRIGALTYYNGGDRILSPRFLYRFSLIIKQWLYWNRTLRELNPDIIITNSIILSWMSLLPEVRRRKSICFVRETIFGSIRHRFNKFLRRLLSDFDRVAFLSEFDRESWNFDKTQSEVIRNFIDTSSLDNTISRDSACTLLNLDPTSFHVLYVGGVSHMKGFDLAIKSVLNLNESKDIDIIIAGVDFDDRMEMGDGKMSQYETEIQSYILQHKYRSKVHMVGRQLNMSRCYAASDVVIVPMRKAHQSRPVFEAGYFSKPVIISDFPNIKEDVIDGSNGYLFESDNIDDLSDKILRFASNRESATIIGNCNREMTDRNHSEASSRQAIVNLIMQIS